MSEWLHQFWYFAFKSPKYWGRGPASWHASELNFPTIVPQRSTPIASPFTSSEVRSPPVFRIQSPGEKSGRLPTPSALCRWSVHCSKEQLAFEDDEGMISEFERLSLQDRQGEDPADESTWKPWPTEWLQRPYHQRLHEAVSTNECSDIAAECLPVALPRALQQDDRADVLQEEGLGFAIMAGNADLVEDLIERIPKSHRFKTYPLHLALSYLNGSKTCCLIVDSLLERFPLLASSVNHLGYSVLDSLMLTLLKSHTSLAPGAVDAALRGDKSFPGQEIDMCGRWDVESDCYRQLLQSGITSIPDEWKHKFCNTSIQTICHCLDAISERDFQPFWGLSNLFSLHCENCGLQMKLSWLHIPVLIAFKLAEVGFEAEDLIGVIAILSNVLQVYYGVFNPSKTDPDEIMSLVEQPCEYVPLSIYNEFLLDNTGSGKDHCCHRRMSAFEFSDSITREQTNKWATQTKTGWEIIWHILRIAINGEEPEEIRYETCAEHGFFELNPNLAELWGAVHAEFLTYRRLNDSDSWTSPNLDLQAVLHSLACGNDLSAGPITDIPLMKTICNCGMFSGNWHWTTAEDASAEYFSNLGNDYDKIQIISPPKRILQLL